jgi:hypothetical protein
MAHCVFQIHDENFAYKFVEDEVFKWVSKRCDSFRYYLKPANGLPPGRIVLEIGPMTTVKYDVLEQEIKQFMEDQKFEYEVYEAP